MIPDKAMQAITIPHFRKLAEKARLPESLVLHTVRDTTDATLTAWEANHMHWDIPTEIRKRIQDHMSSVALN